MNSPSSPQKRRFQLLQADDQFHSPPCPSKRQATIPRLNAASVERLHPTRGDSATLLYQFTSSSTEFNGDNEVIQPMTELVPPASVELIPNSYTTLEDISHNNRLAIQAEMTHGKNLNDYLKFWDVDQATRTENDPMYKYIPCFPITATKAAIYLAYATTRGKVR